MSGLQQDVGSEHRALRCWCNEAPAVVRRGFGGGPARFLGWSGGGPAMFRRRSRRSFFLLFFLLFSSSLLASVLSCEE
ncbi:hypothetical protein MA16_Dca009781 [Dendrobium catenatum]|uniref:Uncharacterized protein n=1 Tax=Dendrobium catenatum TaxID=906689 RepID=A0A2I0XI81_9ASPA|nr:hypothetical protein MA16_Dca009781 [Dendrobium catenatum]